MFGCNDDDDNYDDDDDDDDDGDFLKYCIASIQWWCFVVLLLQLNGDDDDDYDDASIGKMIKWLQYIVASSWDYENYENEDDKKWRGECKNDYMPGDDYDDHNLC